MPRVNVAATTAAMRKRRELATLRAQQAIKNKSNSDCSQHEGEDNMAGNRKSAFDYDGLNVNKLWRNDVRKEKSPRKVQFDNRLMEYRVFDRIKYTAWAKKNVGYAEPHISQIVSSIPLIFCHNICMGTHSRNPEVQPSR
eukprot:sb/3474279/